MVRHLALFNEKPYKTVLINGMVLGNDGRKMSRSLGNYITAPEVLEKHGADAARQWAAAGGRTGADIPFRWSDVEYGWRFLIKLWNVSRFIDRQLENCRKQERSTVRLSTIDRWLLTKLERLIRTVTEAMENYEFNTAVENIRIFTWHILCDQYIEAVKYRLYGEKSPEELIPVQYTLYEALYRILQLLAPICPFITEEIYHALYLEHEGSRSIHLSDWPKYREEFIDEDAESTGELTVALINEIRRLKAQKQISLNTSLREVTILADKEEWLEKIRREEQEIEGTCRVEKLIFKKRSGKEGIELESFKGIAIQLVP
jgi:valyl-tRNA synthetase